MTNEAESSARKMPWRIDHEGNRILLLDDSREWIVCHMSGSLRNPEILADAKLIAEAPAMAELLEAIMVCDALKLREYKLPSSITDEARELLDRLRTPQTEGGSV